MNSSSTIRNIMYQHKLFVELYFQSDGTRQYQYIGCIRSLCSVISYQGKYKPSKLTMYTYLGMQIKFETTPSSRYIVIFTQVLLMTTAEGFVVYFIYQHIDTII